MPRLTSNSMSMSLRMLYLSCVKMRELHCPAKTKNSLHLEGDTVPTRWRFYLKSWLGYFAQFLVNSFKKYSSLKLLHTF